jgi:hypothetical protein
MTEQPSEGELEAQLLRLSRSRASGTRLQATVSATRALLLSRRREREQAEQSQREADREERRAADRGAEDGEELDPAVVLAWLELDILSDMQVALGRQA